MDNTFRHVCEADAPESGRGALRNDSYSYLFYDVFRANAPRSYFEKKNETLLLSLTSERGENVLHRFLGKQSTFQLILT